MTNRINLLFKAFALIFTSLFLFSHSAYAADEDRGSLSMKKPNMFTSEYKPHVGLLAGVTSPEGRGNDEAEVGIDIGYSPTRDALRLGAEFSSARFGEGNNETDRNTLLLKAAYDFKTDTVFLRDSWVGLGAGAVFTDNDTVAVAAPMVGFDIPVTDTNKEYITLGANARYNFIEADAVDTFTLAGAVKYWY